MKISKTMASFVHWKRYQLKTLFNIVGRHLSAHAQVDVCPFLTLAATNSEQRRLEDLKLLMSEIRTNPKTSTRPVSLQSRCGA